MAQLEHIEERIFRPDREDIKSLLEKDGFLRTIVYMFLFVIIAGSLYMLIINNVDSDIDFITRALFMICLSLLAAIYVSRDK